MSIFKQKGFTLAELAVAIGLYPIVLAMISFYLVDPITFSSDNSGQAVQAAKDEREAIKASLAIKCSQDPAVILLVAAQGGNGIPALTMCQALLNVGPDADPNSIGYFDGILNSKLQACDPSSLNGAANVNKCEKDADSKGRTIVKVWKSNNPTPTYMSTGLIPCDPSKYKCSTP